MSRIPIALQMYTLRDDAAKDFAGTMSKAAELGYEGVELAGTGGLSAADLKKLLDDLGLKIAGGHVGIAQMETELEAQMDYYNTLGSVFMTCPYLPEDRRKSADDYKKVGAFLSEVGAKTKACGIQLCYHNHAFEFDRFDGETGFDLLFGAADPELVKVELDTYWVVHGGENVLDTIRRYAGRIPLVHLKDRTAGDNPTFAEVGEGIMDFDAIFAACEESPGVEWYIVEQDTCQRPPIESVTISLNNLRNKGKI